MGRLRELVQRAGAALDDADRRVARAHLHVSRRAAYLRLRASRSPPSPSYSAYCLSVSCCLVYRTVLYAPANIISVCVVVVVCSCCTGCVRWRWRCSLRSSCTAAWRWRTRRRWTPGGPSFTATSARSSHRTSTRSTLSSTSRSNGYTNTVDNRTSLDNTH